MYEEYNDLLKNTLSEKRYIHSINVAKRAVELAKINGFDEEKAELAGLLHDIMKCKSDDELLTLLNSSEIKLDETEMLSPKIWHAPAGYLFVKNELHITDDEILNSVRYHTTGRANMSTLEKIIYLADLTSAERNYPNVEYVRELANKNLDEAMLYHLKFMISDFSSKNIPICKDTFFAYNCFAVLLNGGKNKVEK